MGKKRMVHRKTRRYTKKRKGGEDTRYDTTHNRLEKYGYDNGTMQIIFPTNINQDTHIKIKNQDYDSYDEFPFNVDIQSIDVQMKNNSLQDQTDSQPTTISTQNVISNIHIKHKNRTKYVNLFFYIYMNETKNANLFFSIRKILYNDGILASATNVLFYKILKNAISWNGDTLLIKHNVYTLNNEKIIDPFYTPTKPAIVLNTDMYEEVTSGPEYDYMSNWRFDQKVDMNFKEWVFNRATDFACSIS